MRPAATLPEVRVEDHTRWAKGVAVSIGDRSGLYGVQNRLELEQAALLELCVCAREFDPAKADPAAEVIDAFRGWAHTRIKWAVLKEVRWIGNGGTFDRDRGPKYRGVPVVVEHLSDLLTPGGHDGDPVDIADPRTVGGAFDETPFVLPAWQPRAEVSPQDAADDPEAPPVSDTPPPRFAALETLTATLQSQLAAVEEAKRLLAELQALAAGYPSLAPAIRSECEAIKARKAG